MGKFCNDKKFNLQAAENYGQIIIYITSEYFHLYISGQNDTTTEL